MNPTTATAALDPEACYRAVRGQDRRFDGVFYTAVASTGIYCRPSCPARTPARRNVRFFRTAAAAQQAGFRACKRCRPDATPGSPEWDVAADVTGRAMRLVADGVVDRDGVPGLAARLGYSPRHLTRVLTQQLGAGPLALARAHRAQTARILIETTDLQFADIAFGSGFASIRQFNDTIRQVFAASPRELRGRHQQRGAAPGQVPLRLAVRAPYDGAALLAFLAPRAIPGVEEVSGTHYRRTVRLPHGTGTIDVDCAATSTGSGASYVPAVFTVSDLRDLSTAVERTRRLLDADADPVAIAEVLDSDPILAPLCRQHPGLRVPGQVDGTEIAVRAVLGQQVSVAAARTAATRLVELAGDRCASTPSRVFPAPEAIAALGPEQLPLPGARARALITLCERLADGTIDLDRGAEREAVRHELLAIPGIGPWTADYISLRALGDPDIFLSGDLGTRHALAALAPAHGTLAPKGVETLADAWRPWRSYAQLHLWTSLTDAGSVTNSKEPN